jgi:hypothetical protein
MEVHRHMSWLFVFNDWRYGVVFRFIDIGRIGDQHCLNFLVIATLDNRYDLSVMNISVISVTLEM